MRVVDLPAYREMTFPVADDVLSPVPEVLYVAVRS